MPSIRTSTVAAVSASALAISGVAASSASAGASGCAKTRSAAQSCIEISGSGTRVDSARAVMELRPRSTVRGHRWFSINNRVVRTGPTQTFRNTNFTKYTAHRITALENVTLRDGDKLCAGFRAASATSYAGGACKRIEG